MTQTFLQPAAMLDESEYVTSVPRLLHEANQAWNKALAAQAESERVDPPMTRIKRFALELHAVESWRLRPLEDLLRVQAFVNRRPGSRPGKTERATIEAMTPAQFMRSLFEQGVVFEAVPDDLIWPGLLAFAETHYGTGNVQAARQMNLATIRLLAVRAGIEPVSGELM